MSLFTTSSGLLICNADGSLRGCCCAPRPSYTMSCCICGETHLWHDPVVSNIDGPVPPIVPCVSYDANCQPDVSLEWPSGSYELSVFSGCQWRYRYTGTVFTCGSGQWTYDDEYTIDVAISCAYNPLRVRIGLAVLRSWWRDNGCINTSCCGWSLTTGANWYGYMLGTAYLTDAQIESVCNGESQDYSFTHLSGGPNACSKKNCQCNGSSSGWDSTDSVTPVTATVQW